MDYLTVYTCVVGGNRGTLRGFCKQEQVEKVRFVAYTDGAGSPLGGHPFEWEVRLPVFDGKTDRFVARRHKIMSHLLLPKSKYTLWIDGCLEISDSYMTALPEKYLAECDICVFKHKTRECIGEELEACVRLSKDDPILMKTQVERYFLEGYPMGNGLGETTAILRRNNRTTTRFNELWWRELEVGSVRDQLSFDYVVWKLGIVYNVFEGTCMENDHFEWHKQ